MNIVFLDASTIGPDIDISPLNKLGNLKTYDYTDQSQVVARCKDAQIIITNKVRITKDDLDKLPKLSLICVAATGVDNIDLNECKKRGVLVRNAINYCTESVAQHTLAMVLYFWQKLKLNQEQLVKGEWQSGKIFTDLSHPFGEFYGKRWGVIGLGNIGSKVAKFAHALGFEVVYFSASNQDRSDKYPRLSLDEMLSSCQVISLHAPLTEQTKFLLNENNLNLLQSGSILVNVGRGDLIEPHALVDLANKSKVSIGLDVYAKEPLEACDPIYGLIGRDNVLLTPHVAWSAKEARNRLVDQITKSIQSFLQNS